MAATDDIVATVEEAGLPIAILTAHYGKGHAFADADPPTAAAQTCDEFRQEVDEIVCAFTPEPFYGVGMWYDDFSQTTDDEVRELLRQAREQERREQDEQRLDRAA